MSSMPSPIPSTVRLRPPPAQTITPAEADQLVERLTAEMAQRWRQGDRPLAEEYLARYPELNDHADAAIRLIYEEFCLRKEAGLESSASAVSQRFPRWKGELSVLIGCQQLLEPELREPDYPVVGEVWRGFRLISELGHGAQGKVFLAAQESLGDRPVVLKVSPCDGAEHLTLARLQHSGIVPLYAAFDDVSAGVRAICMPYFGGVTLADLLRSFFEAEPLVERSGSDLVALLDRERARSPIQLPARGPARQFFIRHSYVEAICWIGASLAEALHYAHERGLVHLDIKPSNVLLTVDGQPMLLDFHLTQEPLQPGQTPPLWMGGTPGYIAPEQRQALDAVREDKSIPVTVDGRSDIYSLGIVLYEALGGIKPARRGPRKPLRTLTNTVSPGLSDVIDRCLATHPADRYPTAAALATDLRRHLGNLPLQGVRNRSLRERYRKWRRRRPAALPVLGLLILLGSVVIAAGIGAAYSIAQRRAEARLALTEGQKLLAQHDCPAAIREFERGLRLADAYPQDRGLLCQLDGHLDQARQSDVAERVHREVDQLRFLYATELSSLTRGRAVDALCRASGNIGSC